METLAPLELKDVIELWPKSEEGALCARLLQRYAFSKLVECGVASTCAPDASGGEAGAMKMLASMVKEFAKFPTAAPEKKHDFKLPELNRHRRTDPVIP